MPEAEKVLDSLYLTDVPVMSVHGSPRHSAQPPEPPQPQAKLAFPFLAKNGDTEISNMGTRNIFPILAVNIGYERHYDGLNKKIQDQEADEVCAQTDPLMPSWLTLHGRDLDQVHADLRSPKHLTQHKTARPVEDLPGLGRWYCVECAKWFEGEHSLVQHRRGKNHKRR